MSDRLRNWIHMQRRLVDDGAKATHIRLDGPDETTWGTWPIDTADLYEIIKQQLTDWGEEMPKGSHSARLVALDSDGRQMALLPQTIHGSSAVAKSPGNEAILHSRAHAASVATAERQLESMGNRAVQMEERALNMLSSVIELGGVVSAMQRAAVEEDTLRIEANARAAAITTVADGLAKNAAPLINLLTAALADRLEERAKARADAQAAIDEEDRANASENESSAGTDSAGSDGPKTTGPSNGRSNQGVRSGSAKRSRKRGGATTKEG